MTTARTTKPTNQVPMDAEIEEIDDNVDATTGVILDDPEGAGYLSDDDGDDFDSAVGLAPKAQREEARREPEPKAETKPEPKPAAKQQAAPKAAQQPAQQPAQQAPQQSAPQSAPRAQAAPQTQALQKSETPKPSLSIGAKGFDVENIDQLWRMATMYAKSALVPKAYHGAPEDIVVAMMWGREIGLSPMASLKGIAVINGTPSLWGDALLALCYSSGKLEGHEEFMDGEGADRAAVCRVKRKGQSTWHEQRFGMKQAQAAGLLAKDTYKRNQDRMFMMRARAFALRDKFPDILGGLSVAEEAQDYQVETATTVSEVSRPKFGALPTEEGAA